MLITKTTKPKYFFIITYTEKTYNNTENKYVLKCILTKIL